MLVRENLFKYYITIILKQIFSQNLSQNRDSGLIGYLAENRAVGAACGQFED